MSEFVIENGVLIGYTGNDEHIEIPEGVIEIEERRGNEGVFFKNERIKTVIIPKSMKKIGAFAFRQCTALETVIFRGAPEFSGYTFEGCSSLQEVTIPHRVTRISNSMFEGCKNLRKVTLPTTIERIDVYAFKNCIALKNIVIPPLVDAESVKSLFERGWDDLRIENITIADDNPNVKVANGLLLSKDGTIVHKCIRDQFGEIHIPEGVRIIEPSAFAYCKGEKLIIAKSVREMSNVFGAEASIKAIVFEEGFEELPTNALCCFVSELVLPKSLKMIRRYAFKGLRKLKVLKLYDTFQYEPPRMGSDETFIFSPLPNDLDFGSVERIEVYNTEEQLSIAIGLPCNKETKSNIDYIHLVLYDYITGWDPWRKTFGTKLDHRALEVLCGNGFWYGYKKPESQDNFVYSILPFLHLVSEESAAVYLAHAKKRKKQLLAKTIEKDAPAVLEAMIRNDLLTQPDIAAVLGQAKAEQKQAVLAYTESLF